MKVNPETDLKIETFRCDPLDLSSPYVGVKVTHKQTGLSYECSKYDYYRQNKFECILQILGIVREFYNKHEVIPFKYFSLILEKNET